MASPVAPQPSPPLVAQPKAKRPKVKGAGVLWHAWLWGAWLLAPLAFIVRSVCGVGGWESLFAVLFSPLLVPAIGLLGALPRFALKRLGHRSIPFGVGASMVASGWGLVTLMMSMRGSGDGPSMDSVLGAALGLSRRAEENLLTAGFTVWIVGYAAAVVMVFVWPPAEPAAARDDRQGSLPGAPMLTPGPRDVRRARWSDLVALAAAVLVPVLLVTFAVSADRVTMNTGPKDFGGAREAEVAELTPEQQRDRQAQQWDEAQAALAPLRQAIAPTGWETLGPTAVDLSETGTEPREYRIAAYWRHTQPGDPQSVANHVIGLAEQAGWELDDEAPYGKDLNGGEPGYAVADEQGRVRSVQLDFVNEQGYQLTIAADRPEQSEETDWATEEEREYLEKYGDPAPEESVLRLMISGGPYFQSRGEQFDWWSLEGSGPELPASFDGDDWPTKQEVASAEG